MKNKLGILLLSFSLLLSGCGLIETDVTDKYPGDEFWVDGDADNVESFVLSMYNDFRKATMTKCKFILDSGDLRCAPVSAYNSSYSEELNYLVTNDLSGLKDKYDSQDEGTSAEVGQIINWNYFYQVVASANILLEEIDNMTDITENEVKNFKAEAIFMRCLAYFFMVRVYGDVPYYTNAYNSTPLARTPMVTVLKNCLAELQALIDSDPDKVALPWRYTQSDKVGVRANRGAALCLMMHINMWLVRFDSSESSTYYQNVITLGDELVNQNEGSYELLDLNRTSTIFRGGSREGLFEIAQNLNSDESFLSTAVFSNRFAYSCFPSQTTPIYYYNRDFLITLFPVSESDNRVQLWFNDNIYAVDATSTTPKEVTKFLNVDTYGTSNTITSNSGNQIVFRFADAILLYAEALAANGQDAEAQTQVNKIRTRAGASSITSTGSDLEDDIFMERERELIGEGHYFYDLVRTSRIHDSNYCETTITRTAFNEGAWTWPISRQALVNNSNMTLNQYWE